MPTPLSVTWKRTQETKTSFDPIQKVYELVTTYVVENAPSELVVSTGPGASSFPESQTIQHTGKTIDGNVYKAEVVCWFTRITTNLVSPAEDGLVEVGVHYKGRVTGFHALLLNQSDGIKTIQHGIVPVIGALGVKTWLGIGTDGRGTTVVYPTMQYGLLAVVPTSEVSDILMSVKAITPSVNETNWLPPWALAGYTYPRGYFLATGIASCTSDLSGNRTTEIVFKFVQDFIKFSQGVLMHQFFERKLIVNHSGDKLNQTYGPAVITQIYEVAGETSYQQPMVTQMKFKDALNLFTGTHRNRMIFS